MQIGNFSIPFTKPSSPVIWVRPYHALSIESQDDGTVRVRTSSDGFSIGSIGRYAGIAFGLSLMVIPLIIGAYNVFALTMESDDTENPCDLFSTSEYIEFDDAGIMCLDYRDKLDVSSFESAEGHFRFQSEWSGFEEYRWAQYGHVVTLCFVDSNYDEYSCENLIRAPETLPDQNLSYYSGYDGITQDMPPWVNDRPSSVSVEYQSSSDAPFGTDRLLVAWDDRPGCCYLDMRTYGVTSFEITGYATPFERGILEILFPYVAPMLVGVLIFSFSGARVTLLEFDQRQSKIQRRFNIGTPLSRYDWANVDFQNFSLEEHSFTVTHHEAGDEHTASRTTYTHHSGLNLSCAYEGGTHVLFFIENKSKKVRLDLIEDLFKSLDLESPLHSSDTPLAQPSEISAQSMVRPPLVSEASIDSSNAASSPDVDEDARSPKASAQDTSDFWDNV